MAILLASKHYDSFPIAFINIILSFILGIAYVLYQLNYRRALKKLAYYTNKSGKEAISKIQTSIIFSLGWMPIIFSGPLLGLYILSILPLIIFIAIIGNITFNLWGYIKMYKGSNKKAKQGALILATHSILFLLPIITSLLCPYLVTIIVVIVQWPLFGLGWSKVRASFSVAAQPPQDSAR